MTCRGALFLSSASVRRIDRPPGQATPRRNFRPSFADQIAGPKPQDLAGPSPDQQAVLDGCARSHTMWGRVACSMSSGTGNTRGDSRPSPNRRFRR